MITAVIAPAGVAMKAMGWDRSPRSRRKLLRKPRPGKASNIHRHVSAMMTVEVIQGRRKRPRKKLRPRITPFSTSAMARPVTTLRATETTVKTRLFQTTWWKASSLATIDVVPEADEALGIAHELVGEGQPDRPVEGVEDQPHHEDEEREEKKERGAGFPAPRSESPARARAHPFSVS